MESERRFSRERQGRGSELGSGSGLPIKGRYLQAILAAEIMADMLKSAGLSSGELDRLVGTSAVRLYEAGILEEEIRVAGLHRIARKGIFADTVDTVVRMTEPDRR